MRTHVCRNRLSGEHAEAMEQALLQWFTESGLRPDEVCSLPQELGERVRILMLLVKWVAAWRSCESRQKMKAMGLADPPVTPSCDPDTDWLRFERWVKGARLEQYVAQSASY